MAWTTRTLGELIRESTEVGLAIACARGRVGGRRRLLTQARLQALDNCSPTNEHRPAEIASGFGVSRSTLYRAVAVRQATLTKLTPA